MSVMNFQPSFKDVKPPEKGSFPLDHEGKHQCNTFFITNAKVNSTQRACADAGVNTSMSASI